MRAHVQWSLICEETEEMGMFELKFWAKFMTATGRKSFLFFQIIVNRLNLNKGSRRDKDLCEVFICEVTITTLQEG